MSLRHRARAPLGGLRRVAMTPITISVTIRATIRGIVPVIVLATALMNLAAPPVAAAPGTASEADWQIPVAPADAGPSTTPDAQRLATALATYRKIADAGGWPMLPADTRLMAGQRDPLAAELRERLKITADFSGLPATADTWFFGAKLRTAVQHFQNRHGLPETGEVDEPTLAALNVPVADRVAQLETAIARWNRLPRSFEPRYIWINIPAANLKLINHGATVLEMRVIAGHPERPTPRFRDEVQQLVVNPSWSVPRTIAVEDLLPWQQEDPGFISRLDIRVLDAAGRDLDPKQIDWTRLGPNRFPYRLRQDPGPLNALGRIKFVLHNPWDIYLHDTPSRRLFDLNSRTLSSGCIRLAEPEKLALALGANPRELAMALASDTTRTLKLPAPVPVYAVYLTSWVGQDGMVNFRPDVYGLDAGLR